MSCDTRRWAGILFMVRPTVMFGGVGILRQDEARLSERLKGLVGSFLPASAILLPAAFFLSVRRPEAREPNGFIYLV
jgi:hypothetical protein